MADRRRLKLIVLIATLVVGSIAGIVVLAAVLATSDGSPPTQASGSTMPQKAGGGGMGGAGAGSDGTGSGGRSGGMGNGGGSGGMGKGGGSGGGMGNGSGGMGNGGSSGGTGNGAGGGGAGVGGCSSSETKCNGACVDLQTNFNNCGSCGAFCGQSQMCMGGTCMCTTPMDVKNPGFESGSLSPWMFTSSASGRATAKVVEGSAADTGSRYVQVRTVSPAGTMPLDFKIAQETLACPGTYYDFSFALASDCGAGGCKECSVIACFGNSQSCTVIPEVPEKFTTFSAQFQTLYHTNRTVSISSYRTCNRMSVSVDSIRVSEVRSIFVPGR